MPQATPPPDRRRGSLGHGAFPISTPPWPARRLFRRLTLERLPVPPKFGPDLCNAAGGDAERAGRVATGLAGGQRRGNAPIAMAQPAEPVGEVDPGRDRRVVVETFFGQDSRIDRMEFGTIDSAESYRQHAFEIDYQGCANGWGDSVLLTFYFFVTREDFTIHESHE